MGLSKPRINSRQSETKIFSALTKAEPPLKIQQTLKQHCPKKALYLDQLKPNLNLKVLDFYVSFQRVKMLDAPLTIYENYLLHF